TLRATPRSRGTTGKSSTWGTTGTSSKSKRNERSIRFPVVRFARHDRFLRRMTVRPRPPTRLIFDLAATVLVVYGHQEQARIGYTPPRGGRPAYPPGLCSEGPTKDFWHGNPRPGDAHPASGTLDLLAACFAKSRPESD